MADTVTVGGGGEHRVQVAAAKPCGGQQQQGKKAAAPEKWLNGFVSLVALVERVGNALGTLAFTWATVVLLGGYPTSLTALGSYNDFWFATAIIFLESARLGPICSVSIVLISNGLGIFFLFLENSIFTRPIHLT